LFWKGLHSPEIMTLRIVVKIGTSSLTKVESGGLALSTIASLVEVLAQLRQQQDAEVVLVSSGAVGVGCTRLGLAERPRTITLKQAVAAVGQGHLMRIYDDLCTALRQPIAQILLTRSDLVERNRYINVLNTFQELFELGVIPIVNENDTVAVDELKFGDNDTLSALVASLIHANWLFILTDVDALYSADPRTNPDAQPIRIVERMEDLAQVKAGDRGSRWGTGGMATKIAAAAIATDAGVRTVITQGKTPENILKILAGEAIGTQFLPHPAPINARKHWIAHTLVPAGKIMLDVGATNAILAGGKSLLAAGVTQVSGDFQSQEAVQIINYQGQEIARGIVNYSHAELNLIKGRRSEEIPTLLGYAGADTVVHRDNLVVL
jgi:glutamate 5-kinase